MPHFAASAGLILSVLFSNLRVGFGPRLHEADEFLHEGLGGFEARQGDRDRAVRRGIELAHDDVVIVAAQIGRAHV